MNLSAISRTTCQVTAQRVEANGAVLCEAPASGFFWRANDRIFLVTNRHVISGVNAFTGSIMGFTPNFVKLGVFAERPHKSGSVEMLHMVGKLPVTTENDVPLWKEHPAGRKIDVAVLEVDPSVGDAFQLPCLNCTGMLTGGRNFIGDDVFIVGYPEGQAFDRAMPLWKRGSIATDPDLNQMDLPQIYVDTIGNKGLSGSPVFSKTDGSERPLDKTVENEASHFRFLGVYAGRLGEKGLGSQVGRVYKPSTLYEILDGIIV